MTQCDCLTMEVEFRTFYRYLHCLDQTVVFNYVHSFEVKGSGTLLVILLKIIISIKPFLVTSNG